MLVDFGAMQEISVPHLDGGEGEVIAKMRVEKFGRVILCRIPAGSSVGLHTQNGSTDFNFVVSGEGLATCDGAAERLTAGVCHICPSGSAHSIANTGADDLVLFTAVTNDGAK